MKNIVQRMRQMTAKQAVIAGVFTLALAGSVALGLNSSNNLSAATVRDCSANSIDKEPQHGGCGAATGQELYEDYLTNSPSDLQAIYGHFGLSSADAARFASEAKMGMAYKNGNVVVDGQLVMNDAWSIGRTKFGYSTDYPIAGAGTYYKSMHTSVLKSDIPVMVLFAPDGSVEFAALTACGNPVEGNKVRPSGVCDALVSTKTDKTNEYSFTTQAHFSINATFSRAVYTFSDDGSSVTATNLNQAVKHTFKKSGTASVKVYFKVPGGREVEAQVINCAKKITVTPPMYVCKALVATVLDNQARKFRFSVKAESDATTTLLSADFSLDGAAKVNVAKDAQGNISKDYSFTDAVKHVVVATVNFNTVDGVKSVTCQASVTPKEQPKCELPGKESYPPNAPECAEEKQYCLPNIPVGDERCTPPEELPHTGPGNVLGLFAGVSGAGAVAHRVFLSRRARRS